MIGKFFIIVLLLCISLVYSIIPPPHCTHSQRSLCPNVCGTATPLNTDITGRVKLIMAVLIVMCHVAGLYPETVFFREFASLGAICVGGFFFFSGYGMAKSYGRKGEAYWKDYFHKRFLKLLPPFLIATFIWIIVERLCIGKADFLHALAGGNPPLPTSWFVVAMAFLYLMFYLSFKHGKNNVSKNLLLLVAVALYCLMVRRGFGWGTWWVNAIYTFNIGVAIALCEESIRTLLAHRSLGILSAVLVAAGAAVGVLLDLIYLYIPALILLLYLSLVNIPTLTQYKPEKILGSVTYEVYLVQGACVAIADYLFYMENQSPWFISLAVVAAAFILAAVLNKVTSLVMKRLFAKNKLL